MSKKHGEWINSLSGKNSDLEKRLGVGPVKISRPGSPTWEEDRAGRESYKDDLINAARNDYDLRETVAAAARSGKKKAIKLEKKGFKDIGDINNWINFSEKAAKRHGQGGDFADASDYMGLTKSMQIRDRRKFTEEIEGMIDDPTKEKKEEIERISRAGSGSWNDNLESAFGDRADEIAYGPGYSKAAQGKASDDADAAAQGLLAETVKKVVGDKAAVGKAKYKQGNYVLNKLGEKTYQSNQEGF